MNDPQILAVAELRAFAVRLFQAEGISASEAEVVAESLVEANLRGHDSHGVVRVSEYVQQLRAGELAASAPFETLRETASILVCDGRFGFGQVQMKRLVEQLVAKAREQGLACGTLHSCGHVGRLGEWVERVAGQGLAGLITVNDNGVLQCVAPPGGTQPRISTNPLAIGVPAPGDPMVLDISTSAVANGKIQVARLAGKQCPPGWLQDAQGQPTTDPATRFHDPPGTLLPMGGPQGYKGFGLGLMLDLLVGGLSGGSCPPATASAKMSNNVLLVVWDPNQFSGGAHFSAEAEKLIDYVRSVERKAGVEAIRLPSDRANQFRRERAAAGIPLDRGTWQTLVDLAEELGVELPEVSRSTSHSS